MPFRLKQVICFFVALLALGSFALRGVQAQSRSDPGRSRLASRPDVPSYKESLARMMLEDARQWADREMYDAARKLVERTRNFQRDWPESSELHPDAVMGEIDKLQFGDQTAETPEPLSRMSLDAQTDGQQNRRATSSRDADDRPRLSADFIPLPDDYSQRSAASSEPVPIQITHTESQFNRVDLLIFFVGCGVGGALLIGGLHVVLKRLEMCLKRVRVELVHTRETDAGRVAQLDGDGRRQLQAATASASSDRSADQSPVTPVPGQHTTPAPEQQITPSLENAIHTIARAGAQLEAKSARDNPRLGLVEQVIQNNLDLRKQLAHRSM